MVISPLIQHEICMMRAANVTWPSRSLPFFVLYL